MTLEAYCDVIRTQATNYEDNRERKDNVTSGKTRYLVNVDRWYSRELSGLTQPIEEQHSSSGSPKNTSRKSNGYT